MKIITSLVAIPVLFVATSGIAQQKPDDACMEVMWHESSQAGGMSGWKYRYSEKKAKSAACKALQERAAADYATNYPSSYDEKTAEEARQARGSVVSSYEATQAAHRDAKTEAGRLGDEYRRLLALYEGRDFGPYRSQLPAYLAGLDGYPAYAERFTQAQATGVSSYNAFRDRYRNNPYPSAYDWAKGGDQGLWTVE